MKTGVYETDYGNAAVVSSKVRDRAYDLDAGEVITMELVTRKWLRPVEDCDGDAIDALEMWGEFGEEE